MSMDIFDTSDNASKCSMCAKERPEDVDVATEEGWTTLLLEDNLKLVICPKCKEDMHQCPVCKVLFFNNPNSKNRGCPKCFH